MGPNCLGVLNTHHHMNATFAPALPPPGGISLISQSGALCVAILDWASKQKLGMSKDDLEFFTVHIENDTAHEGDGLEITSRYAITPALQRKAIAAVASTLSSTL